MKILPMKVHSIIYSSCQSYHFIFIDDSPGISLATALVAAIRAKQPVEDLLELMNSAPAHVSDEVSSDADSMLNHLLMSCNCKSSTL